MTSSAPALASTLMQRLLARTRLRQLQLLVRSAELGSIQAAAGDAGLTQSAATKAVAELEQLLGVALFERHARGVRPTPACDELLPLMRNVLRSLGDCAQALAARSGGGRGLIRVGAITGAATGLLPAAVPAFRADHPSLSIELTEDRREALESGLAEGQFDLLFLRRPGSVPAGHRFVELHADEAVVFTGPSHPLASRRSLRPQQLLPQRWILPPLGSEMHRAFERLFAPIGASPQSSGLTTRSLAMVLVTLRTQDAVSLAPRSLVQPFFDSGELSELPITVPYALPPIGLLIPEPAPRMAVRQFADFVQAWARGRPS